MAGAWMPISAFIHGATQVVIFGHEKLHIHAYTYMQHMIDACLYICLYMFLLLSIPVNYIIYDWDDLVCQGKSI